MARSLSIGEALHRLEGALGRLEAALDVTVEEAGTAKGLEGELYRLGADRSRLAETLDAAEARAARLAETNALVSRRLVAAMETIRDVLSRRGA